jgi:hypothetical protein
MKADDRFSAVVDQQEIAHCGPTSLASCLAMLGIQTDQREVAKAAGKPFRVYREGLDENDLRRAARKLGAKCELILEPNKIRGGVFLKKLTAHLRKDLPAILLVDNCGHWVAVLGMLGEKYVIMDPNAENEFGLWSGSHLLRKRAWNLDLKEKGEERERVDQYFAILVSRLDGKAAAWMTTKSFLKICTYGSIETLADMTRDLKEIALRASIKPTQKPQGMPLAKLLGLYQATILDNVNHWAAYHEVGPRDLRSFYRDMMVVADSARIRLPAKVDEAALVAQVTTLVTTYAWTGML